MSEEQISAFARMNAERLMRGGKVSESEMCVIIAGLMLSVDKLANSFDELKEQLWSEEKMRKMIAEEVDKHCAASKAYCAEKAEKESEAAKPSKSATWVGRMLRSFAGIKCLVFWACLLVALCNTGCATYATRLEREGVVYQKPYPATQLDIWTAWYMASTWDLGFLWFVPCVADLPFSLVSDTVCLPYDLIITN